MTSNHTPSKPSPRQQMSPPQHHSTAAAAAAATASPGSPPTKRDLKSWWKRFQVQSKHHETQETRQQGIFGIPLRQSIPYANVAISLVDEDGKSYIYGYVPIVVAKCGVFLKEKATGIEGIFRLNGSEKRIKELKIQFDSPDRYGKGLVWDGFTVHDAANVLRRYLNDLPEPVVPLDLYESFRDPLRGHSKQAVGDIEGAQLMDNFDDKEAIQKYQQLIKELPPLNRQLLLYILDLLAVFAAKADENRMTAQNLAAIFQPGMLSHPQHAMAPEEYRLNQCVIIFLIENQDHFLLSMPGAAIDDKTKSEIEKATPAVLTPTTPARKSGLTVKRSASNASAGAESVSRDGMIRRNRSTSSRHSRQSRQSNGASTPGSPSVATTPGSGLGRSNTVPSKSPHLTAGRFSSRQNSPVVAMTPASPSPTGQSSDAPPPVMEETPTSTDRSPAASSVTQTATGSSLMPEPHTAAKSQERLLEPPSEVVTPSKERNLQNLFQRSPTSDSERRQPNKLRKKRLPSSTNPSAQSSTTSLPHSGAISPTFESADQPEHKAAYLEPVVPENGAVETPSEPTPRASQVPSANNVPAGSSDSKMLKPRESEPTSLHSSFNEGSDMDQVDELHDVPTDPHDKEKKRRWRISRRRDDVQGHPGPNLGANNHAEMSTSTVGSGHRPRKSWTGESSDVAGTLAESEAGSREKDESKGPIGWIKNKYREAKETAEQKRTKSPPEQAHGSLPSRNKSVDLKRSMDEKATSALPAPASTSRQSSPPQDVPLPTSPPPTRATHDEKTH